MHIDNVQIQKVTLLLALICPLSPRSFCSEINFARVLRFPNFDAPGQKARTSGNAGQGGGRGFIGGIGCVLQLGTDDRTQLVVRDILERGPAEKQVCMCVCVCVCVRARGGALARTSLRRALVRS